MKKTLVFIAVLALALATTSVANAQTGYGGGGGGGTTFCTTERTTFCRNAEGQLLGAFGQVIPGEVLGASTFGFNSFLGLGSRGPEVIALQDRLRAEGFFNAPSTGYFGPVTLAAVQAYQRAHGISDTGFVGPLTLASLNSTATVAFSASSAQANSLRSQLISLINQLMAQLQAQLAAAQASGNY